LVIVDEAGMADTLSLDTAVNFIVGRGGSVRLVGDDQQLAAIGAGGALRDIQASHGAVRLSELHRFSDPVDRKRSASTWTGNAATLETPPPPSTPSSKPGNSPTRSAETPQMTRRPGRPSTMLWCRPS
jgi:hypothetical protein